MDIDSLSRIAAQRRADAVTMITRAGTGHTGGAMSCLDLLTCLFYDVCARRIILSSAKAIRRRISCHLSRQRLFPQAAASYVLSGGQPPHRPPKLQNPWH